MADKLSERDVEAGIAGTDWRRDGDAIVRERELADFRAALAWVDVVGAEAEAANHHPDILIHGYNRVRLSVTNHSAGGLTQADFDLAASIDALPGG
jgi:4a-hydroxytetrahydrobiopterin dehydratase